MGVEGLLTAKLPLRIPLLCARTELTAHNLYLAIAVDHEAVQR